MRPLRQSAPEYAESAIVSSRWGIVSARERSAAKTAAPLRTATSTSDRPRWSRSIAAASSPTRAATSSAGRDTSPGAGAVRARRWCSCWPCQVVAVGERLDVAPVEHLDAHVRIQLAQAPHLAVLLRDERLLHRRHFDVEVLLGQVEVGGEGKAHLAVRPRLEHERMWLVLPGDAVKVEHATELALGVVGETWGHPALPGYRPGRMAPGWSGTRV